MNGLQQATTRALRLLAPNPGPMTLDGTNTWILRAPENNSASPGRRPPRANPTARWGMR